MGSVFCRRRHWLAWRFLDRHGRGRADAPLVLADSLGLSLNGASGLNENAGAVWRLLSHGRLLAIAAVGGMIHGRGRWLSMVVVLAGSFRAAHMPHHRTAGSSSIAGPPGTSLS